MRRKNIKRQKTEIWGLKIPFFLLPILILSGMITIYLAIDSATMGAKLTQLEKRQMALIRETKELSGRLVEASSLVALEEKADSLGFEKPVSILYITDKDAVATLP